MVKVLCILNGIGLWNATYPEDNEDETLISGLLGAINMFVKQTHSQIIRNIVLENAKWTFTTVHNMDNCFLVVQTPILSESDQLPYETKLIEKLVSEILQELTRRYPRDLFINFRSNLIIFNEIKEFANRKIKSYYELLRRRDYANPTWLAGFSESEKLFTTILTNDTIYILCNSKKDLEDYPDLLKFQASVESLGYSKNIINGILNFKELTAQTQINQSAIIFLVNNNWGESLAEFSGTIIDISSNKILQGPKPNSIAEKLVKYLHHSSPEQTKKTLARLNAVNKNTKDAINFEYLIADSQQTQTEFNCKLCNAIVKFNIDDENTYLTKVFHEKFLGIELSNYRIAHFAADEMHINNVLVSHLGSFHSYVDAYAIKLTAPELAISPRADFRIIQDSQNPLRTHSQIRSMLIFNMQSQWIFEVLCPPSLNSVELIKLLLDKVRESYKIYTEPPDYLSILVADKKFHLWMSNSTAICANFINEGLLDFFNPVAKRFLKEFIYEAELPVRRARINLALKFIDQHKVVNEDADAVLKLIFNDLFSSRIKIKYDNHISQIVERVSREFNLPKNVLEGLLQGEKTVLDLLNDGYIDRFRDLHDLIEFINRRNLLS